MSPSQSNAGSKAAPKQAKDDDDREWRQLLESTAKEFEDVRRTICAAAMNNFGKPLPLTAAPRKILKVRTARTIKAQQASISEGVANLSLTDEPLPVARAIAKSSNQQTAPPRLFILPQRVQDAIFDHSYGNESSSKLVFKGVSFKLQAKPANQSGNSRPFPPHKVNEWLVSKRYFRSAAQAWMKAQTFPYIRTRAATALNAQFFLDMKTGTFLDYGVHASLRYPLTGWGSTSETLNRCRSLKSLVLVVGYSIFSLIKDKRPWRDEFDDIELELIVNTAIKVPSGLKKLRIVPETDPLVLREYSFTEKAPGPLSGSETQYTFQNNVYALERMVKKKLLRDFDAADGSGDLGVDNRASTQTGMLYTGSQVSYP